jgi:hypothetical protein
MNNVTKKWYLIVMDTTGETDKVVIGDPIQGLLEAEMKLVIKKKMYPTARLEDAPSSWVPHGKN